MTLDASRETKTQTEPTCHFCGGKFDLGYHYACHTCGATYCYIHMNRHTRAHGANSHQGKPSVPPDASDPVFLPKSLVLAV